MIHRVYSSLSTFKELAFHPGLNILLAEKSLGATERQTRNRAGKSSFSELVHFLTGGEARPDSLFRTESLLEYWFGMEFDLGGHRTRLERSGQSSSKIRILEGYPDYWPIKPVVGDDDEANWFISNTHWKAILGALIFGLSTDDETGGKKKQFSPTFRSLFAYFVRRQSAGGFIEPVKQAEKQQLWDQQVATSYLLGLDWTIPQEWQILRKKEQTLQQLKRAAGEGEFLESIIGTTAELRSELAIAQEGVRRLKKELGEFRVLPEYHALEAEASELVRTLGSLANENTVDRHLIAEMERSLAEETAPPLDTLHSLYEEAGILLPDAVTRRFEEVRAFHESIIRNRRVYLEGEIDAARHRMAERGQLMQQIADRQTQIMSILESHGALEQFMQLQSEVSRLEAEMEATHQRFLAAEEMESLKTELTIGRNQLLIRLRQDLRERADKVQKAILYFEEVSKALYEEAGRLTISGSPNGPQFEIRIQGAKSKGITNMQIFCFDMMLMRIRQEQDMGPGFLIHDSHLFDGVDERQIARALQVGAELANDLDFQYVVTMNSDILPHDYYSGDFDVDEHILSTRLTDAREDGGLFGFRFS
jgi:uncharacterized protein YydD (DUF2326 family)